MSDGGCIQAKAITGLYEGKLVTGLQGERQIRPFYRKTVDDGCLEEKDDNGRIREKRCLTHRGEQFATHKAGSNSTLIHREVDSTCIQGEGDPNRIHRRTNHVRFKTLKPSLRRDQTSVPHRTQEYIRE